MHSNVFHISVLLRRLLVEEIARKMDAQLGKLRDFGVPISYVDSHGHLHKFAPFLCAMRSVLPRFGIRRVRGVQNFYLKPPRKSPTYWFSPIWRKQIRKYFLSTDYFYMPASGGDKRWGPRVLQKLPPGTLEVGVHPGRDTKWQADETASVLQFADEA
jgi:chitin disaccharide deacetylase